MRNDPELEIEDDMSGNRTYSARKRRTESGGSNPLRIMLVAFPRLDLCRRYPLLPWQTTLGWRFRSPPVKSDRSGAADR